MQSPEAKNPRIMFATIIALTDSSSSDADSNAFYYVDKKMGTTQWEHPNPEGVVVALTESNPMHSRNETQLPAGWERSYTEDGDKYYVNEAEGESSWEPPAGSTRGGGAMHSRDETQLPAGWEKNWTEDGDKFYANEDSGESSWDPPRGSTGGSAGPAL